jgi:hypothetical protein
VTDFGREQRFELSNWGFGTANIFSYYYSIYVFLSRNFILSGCDMVGKICGEKKKSIVGLAGIVGVLARNLLRYLPD